VHFDWEQLTDSVHRCRLPFLDVTVGLVQGRSGALLVDTGTTLVEAQAIDADVQQIAERRVTHVVLTHKHFDHVLGSGVFAKRRYIAHQRFSTTSRRRPTSFATTRYVMVRISRKSTVRSRHCVRLNTPPTALSSTSELAG
jgi:glyoxylase-like metal-dependent hydrolase (beta-lactamase superfamily II)